VLVDGAHFSEVKHKVIVVNETDYEAGDQFELRVRYDWNGSPARDFTVKVYSKQELHIVNA
jgi:hypothetical protein